MVGEEQVRSLHAFCSGIEHIHNLRSKGLLEFEIIFGITGHS